MRPFGTFIVLTLILTVAPLVGQGPAPAPAMPPRALPAGPLRLDTAEQGPITVTVMKGLSHPWSLAFMPDGNMLVTERPGRLRIVRKGVLDPKPIAGVPAVFTERLGGLMEVVLHPRFAETRW